MNSRHLHRFSSQTHTWNEWRQKYPRVRPDLSEARLNLRESNSTLDRKESIFSVFQQRSFQGIDLHDADLRSAKILHSHLTGSDLKDADLSGAEIRRSHLNGADLRGANLRETQFIMCDLTGAQFDGALFDKTYLGFTKLINVQGLSEVTHKGQTRIDQFSVISSTPLPLSFLEACGVQPHIRRMAELHALSRQYHTCFISYSRRDEVFVSYLREALSWEGVPSWFAPQDLRDKEFESHEFDLERDLYEYVDAAERVLLVMSPNILSSNWVGKESQRARNFTEVIPVLIEEMPDPDGPEWESLIAKTVESGKYTQLSPESYSTHLKQLVNGSVLEMFAWRSPSILAERLRYLLPLLRVVPDKASSA